MQVAYGPVRFAAGAVSWRVSCRTIKNEAEFPVRSDYRVDCDGDLLGVSQADIFAQSATLQAAFKLWGRDLVLYKDDGTIAEAMRNATSLTGVSIPEWSFPMREGPGEGNTCRSFSFAAEASYPPPSGVINLVSYTQRLRVRGGFPVKSFLRPKSGPVIEVIESSASEYTGSQSGTAVGLLARPSIPPPVFPGAVVDLETEIIDPQLTAMGWRNFGVSWTYTYASAAPLR